MSQKEVTTAPAHVTCQGQSLSVINDRSQHNQRPT